MDGIEAVEFKRKEDKYIEDLFYYLDANIRIVGGIGMLNSEGKIRDPFRKMNIVELAQHLFPNGIEFKIYNRRLIEDPYK